MPRPSAAPLVGLALLATAAAILRRRPLADLRDRVVLVTGSSRGFGLALAEEFASHGAKLVLCARTPEPLERARKRLEARGTDVLAVTCDITERDQIDALIARANARFGQIDVLVNNAGVITVGPVETQTLDDFEEAMRVMFWGPLYMTMAVLPGMRARGEGHIVNITSVGGRMSVPHLLPYSTAKFAAVGFSEGLHAELARDGIHVTTVVPGLMRTGSHVNVWTKGNHELEYTLFSLLATLPFTSIDAREAARQVVHATRRGDAEAVLSLQAKLAVLAHGVLPGTVQNAFGIVSRFMPAGDGTGDAQRLKGRNSANSITESFLTALGRRAAADLNQGED